MLLSTLKNAPDQAGIYQFFNEKNTLLYVGKAKNIKNRVKSYFRFTPTLAPSPILSARVTKMISEANRVEFIVTQSEHDALILENSLIKQLKPKYNILLRDDKTYPYICIDLKEPFPRFEITRKIIDDKNIRYFGPLSTSAKSLLDALYLAFPLVQKKGCLKEKKACLFHQINRCLAPCENKIDALKYAVIVNEALESLEDQKRLISTLQEKMQTASLKLNFEEAAKLRDIINSIKGAFQTTRVELLKNASFDVFGVEIVEKTAVIMRLFIRNGKIVSTSHSTMHNAFGFDKDELYQRAIYDFYHLIEQSFTQEILVADAFLEMDEMQLFLSEKFGKKMTILAPKRGEKMHLCAMAKDNAKNFLLQNLTKNPITLYEQIQKLFDLTMLPKRIEIFDNSHLGGVAPVGAMVVWDDGFVKSSYRRYSLLKSDEYAQMSEMLTRRINDFDKEPPPDLWVLDGGSTLLNLAKTLLEKAGANLDVLAIAKEKKDAKAHRTKGSAHDILHSKSGELKLPASDKRLQFIQRLRDEAHRFAITYHQKKKRGKDMSLELEKIDGIGKATIKKLLLYFGTFEAIYQASKEDLQNAIGAKLGESLFNELKN